MNPNSCPKTAQKPCTAGGADGTLGEIFLEAAEPDPEQMFSGVNFSDEFYRSFGRLEAGGGGGWGFRHYRTTFTNFSDPYSTNLERKKM